MPRTQAIEPVTDKQQRNEGYKQALANLVGANQRAFARLRLSMTVTYYLMLLLLTAMFVVGVVLIAAGGWRATGGDVDQETLVGLGAGGADLVLLGLARPVERIRQIKSDRAQMFVLLSDYHLQTTAALLWYKADDPKTILQAADRIRDLTIETVHMIETYLQFGRAPLLQPDALARLEDQNRRVVDALADHLDVKTPGRLRDGLAATLRRSPRGVPEL